MQIISNEHRRAVINGNKVECFRNSGTKRETWNQVWPALEADEKRKLKRMAKRWVEKAKLPQDLN